MENIQNLKQNIIEKSPSQFKDEIQSAIDFCIKQHKDEIGLTEIEFVLHPLSVGLILSEIGSDTTTIIAGILHSTKEENFNEISKLFGEEVKEIIKQAKDIEKAIQNDESSDEIKVRYILNMSKDLRPLILKLADTLSNIRMIEEFPPEIQKFKSKKVLSIYSPIAEYLNFNSIKKEIEEKAFAIQNPLENSKIKEKMQTLGIDENLLQKYKNNLEKILKEFNPKIAGRIKSRYSIYNKLKKYEKEWVSPQLDRIDDIIGFRLIPNTKEDCFKILEILIDNADVLSDSFDDYISNPKPNGYMAMQATMIFKDISQTKVEVQILTEEMQYNNTYGSASHIAYKASKSRFAKPTNEYNWVEEIHKNIERSIKERENSRSVEIKANIFSDEIFALTPKGKVIQLDRGDTVLDFAFKVHTKIGHQAESAIVNNKPAKLGQVLKTGDIVQIKTQKDKTFQKEKALEYAHSQISRWKIIKELSKQKYFR